MPQKSTFDHAKDAFTYLKDQADRKLVKGSGDLDADLELCQSITNKENRLSVLFEGTLKKKGNVNPSFKDRYCALLYPGCLFYFASRSECKLFLTEARHGDANTARAQCKGSITMTVKTVVEEVVAQETQFTINLEPRWLQDETVSHCPKCNNGFSFFNRRHHCRMCGGIFCKDCSKWKLQEKRACKLCVDKNKVNPVSAVPMFERVFTLQAEDKDTRDSWISKLAMCKGIIFKAKIEKALVTNRPLVEALNLSLRTLLGNPAAPVSLDFDWSSVAAASQFQEGDYVAMIPGLIQVLSKMLVQPFPMKVREADSYMDATTYATAHLPFLLTYFSPILATRLASLSKILVEVNTAENTATAVSAGKGTDPRFFVAGVGCALEAKTNVLRIVIDAKPIFRGALDENTLVLGAARAIAWTLVPELAAKDEKQQVELSVLEDKYIALRAEIDGKHDVLVNTCHAKYHPPMQAVENKHRPFISSAENDKQREVDQLGKQHQEAVRKIEDNYKPVIAKLERERDDGVKTFVKEQERKKAAMRETHVKKWREHTKSKMISTCSKCKSSNMYVCGDCTFSYCTKSECDGHSNRCPKCSKCAGIRTQNVYNANPPNSHPAWNEISREQRECSDKISKATKEAENKYRPLIEKPTKAMKSEMDKAESKHTSAMSKTQSKHKSIIDKLQAKKKKERDVYAIPCAKRETEIARLRSKAQAALQLRQNKEALSVRKGFR